jgi:hypothetical protein
MHSGNDTIKRPERNRNAIGGLNRKCKIGSTRHQRIGWSTTCTFESNGIDVDTDIAMHLSKPHPRSIDNRATTGVELMVRVSNGEIAISFFRAPDADRAPVDERSIKEPHRAET